MLNIIGHPVMDDGLKPKTAFTKASMTGATHHAYSFSYSLMIAQAIVYKLESRKRTIIAVGKMKHNNFLNHLD